MLPLQRKGLDGEAEQHTNAGQSRKHNPHDLQRIVISADKIILHLRRIHALNDTDDNGCVSGKLQGLIGKSGQVLQLRLEDILEEHTADSNTDALAKGASEGEEGRSFGIEERGAGGLDGEGQAGEEHSGADADGDVEEDPLGDGGLGVEEVEEAGAEGGDDPAGPERPAVAACDGGDYADDHAGGGDG